MAVSVRNEIESSEKNDMLIGEGTRRHEDESALIISLQGEEAKANFSLRWSKSDVVLPSYVWETNAVFHFWVALLFTSTHNFLMRTSPYKQPLFERFTQVLFQVFYLTMSTCTACSEALSFTSPSVINRCGHVFHESCGFRISFCPSCPETMADLEKIYFSVFSFDNENLPDGLTEAKAKIEELNVENVSLRDAPDSKTLPEIIREKLILREEDVLTLMMTVEEELRAVRERNRAMLQESEQDMLELLLSLEED
ncbi:hypothetical protein L596_016881 [Steinernema carpocapsae]|uniref:RING-type domain-containing protein n=1 Tax=Steinernema carpocapsae TaxID=34508 RepID=A0A4U5NJA0_STECR|nr:hypothetical protein L596_016881 [Steinernema carpocapsae]